MGTTYLWLFSILLLSPSLYLLWCDLLLLPFKGLVVFVLCSISLSLFTTVSLLALYQQFIIYYIYYKRNFSQPPLQRKRKKVPAGSGVVPYISINYYYYYFLLLQTSVMFL